MSHSLRELCREYGIEFKKRLGQNLLLDDNINRIMVDAAALNGEEDIVEVGAGLGALTDRLYRGARRVLAVEIDRAFMPVLEDRFGEAENVVLFRGDILNHSLAKLLDEFLPDGGPYKMVSNLPYYITTPVLFHFLEAPVRFERLVVMVQEEVALRMTAPVGDPDYGILSLVPRLYAEVDIVHRVPRTCFVPRPKVDSCIVRLRMRREPLFAGLEPKFITALVRAAFSARRKTLRNALIRTGQYGAPREVVLESLEAANIDPGRRAQTLTLEDFGALAREVHARTH